MHDPILCKQSAVILLDFLATFSKDPKFQVQTIVCMLQLFCLNTKMPPSLHKDLMQAIVNDYSAAFEV